MQQKMGFDQEALNDAGLIALLCQTELEIEEHGESNQVNLLLREFARELLKYRLLGVVQFIRGRLSPAKAESVPTNRWKPGIVSDVSDGEDTSDRKPERRHLCHE